MSATRRETFYEAITAAVADVAAHGFDSEGRIADWVARIREAALRDLVPLVEMEAAVKKALGAAYMRYVEHEGILVRHGDVPRFTIDRVRPKLRAELDRRIVAATSLIKLNRTEAVEQTLRRFQGWATSIPIGGSATIAKNPVKSNIRKSLAQLPFEERRVAIDQQAKLVSSISNIIATDGGAIAVRWHSHWRDPGYNAREAHKERDGLIYVIKDNWAIKGGLMNKGPNGYYEDITAFAQEPFCRCYGGYIYALRRLPEEFLTRAGIEAAQPARLAA